MRLINISFILSLIASPLLGSLRSQMPASASKQAQEACATVALAGVQTKVLKDQKRLALACMLSNLPIPDLWDIICAYGNEPHLKMTFAAHKKGANCIAKIDDHHFVSGGNEAGLKLWQKNHNTAKGVYTAALNLPISLLTVLNGNTLVSDGAWINGYNSARMWHIQRDGQNINTIQATNNELKSRGKILKHLSAMSENAVALCYDKDIHMVRIGDRLQVTSPIQKSTQNSNHSCNTWEDDFSCVARVTDEILATGHKGTMAIKLWDIRTGTCLKLLTGHNSIGRNNNILCLAAINQGSILSGSTDMTIKLWSTGPTSPSWFSCDDSIRTFEGHGNSVTSLAVINNEYFVSGSSDNTIKLWHIPSGKLIKTFYGHSGAICSLVVMNENEFLSASADGTIKLWAIWANELPVIERKPQKKN